MWVTFRCCGTSPGRHATRRTQDLRHRSRIRSLKFKWSWRRHRRFTCIFLTVVSSHTHSSFVPLWPPRVPALSHPLATVAHAPPRSSRTGDPGVSLPLPWAPPSTWPRGAFAPCPSASCLARWLPCARTPTSGRPWLKWPPCELLRPCHPSPQLRSCWRAETGLWTEKREPSFQTHQAAVWFIRGSETSGIEISALNKGPALKTKDHQ